MVYFLHGVFAEVIRIFFKQLDISTKVRLKSKLALDVEFTGLLADKRNVKFSEFIGIFGLLFLESEFSFLFIWVNRKTRLVKYEMVNLWLFRLCFIVGHILLAEFQLSVKLVVFCVRLSGASTHINI